MQNLKETIESLKTEAEQLLKSGLVPSSYKSKEDIVKALALGRELGMTGPTALRNIDMIQGNPAVSSKMLAALMTSNGIALEIVKDYEAVIEERPAYILDEKNAPRFDEQGRALAYKGPDGQVIMKSTEIDRVTRVRAIRYYPSLGREISCEVEFRLSDAKTAGWYPSKATWRTMPRFLMLWRCISLLSRLVGSQYTLGLYSTEEVAEFSGVELQLNEDGEIIAMEESSKTKNDPQSVKGHEKSQV